VKSTPKGGLRDRQAAIDEPLSPGHRVGPGVIPQGRLSWVCAGATRACLAYAERGERSGRPSVQAPSRAPQFDGGSSPGAIIPPAYGRAEGGDNGAFPVPRV
jgi:hypothetical protein